MVSERETEMKTGNEKQNSEKERSTALGERLGGSPCNDGPSVDRDDATGSCEGRQGAEDIPELSVSPEKSFSPPIHLGDLLRLVKAINEDHGRILGILRGLDEGRRNIEERLARLARETESLAVKEKALEAAHEQSSRLQERFYQEHVLSPLSRSTFPLFDTLRQAVGQFHEAGPEPQMILESLKAAYAQVGEFFATLGIEAYRSQEGTRFDRRKHHAISFRKTEDSLLHLKVAKSERCGFRMGGQCLRPEAVTLYRAEDRSAQNHVS